MAESLDPPIGVTRGVVIDRLGRRPAAPGMLVARSSGRPVSRAERVLSLDGAIMKILSALRKHIGAISLQMAGGLFLA